MNTITFSVQGSAEIPYKVTFRKNESNLSARCSCPAGINGLYCKHRFRLMRGEVEGVVGDRLADALLVKSWLAGTDVETALSELATAEVLLEAAKKQVQAAKKKIARALID